MIKCLICLREFKNRKALSTHINLSHQLTSKQYYDKFIKKDDDGICLTCGQKTNYRNLNVGYLKTCSKKCDALYKKQNNKTTNYWLGKKQPKEMILKRINNTDQKLKEKNRENTFLEKYGVSNYSQTSVGRKKTSDTFKGKIVKRTDEHQRKIIESKISNGTTKHTEETKRKISISNSGENNPFIRYLNNGGKIPKNSGGISGYYGELYFRSSLELSTIHYFKEKKFTILSAENNNYKVVYFIDGKQKSYYPDFFIVELDLVVEIKPHNLLSYYNNKLKTETAKKIFNNFKVLTEKEIPYLKKEIIDFLVKEGKIILDERSKKKLERYRH
jgi:hypothetical protein